MVKMEPTEFLYSLIHIQGQLLIKKGIITDEEFKAAYAEYLARNYPQGPKWWQFWK